MEANPRRLVALCGWLLLSLPACTPADPALGTYVGDEVTHNDFEAFRGWGTGDTTALSARCPRSGRWAVRVDAAHPVGPVFKASLGAACVHTLKAVEAEAWVSAPAGQTTAGQTAAVWRVEVWPAAGGSCLHREEWPLPATGPAQAGHPAEWTQVRHIFKLPAGLNSADYLCLTLAHTPNASPLYLDDLVVKARE